MNVEQMQELQIKTMSKLQVIKYKCCNKIFAACAEPHFYTDAHWLKDVKNELRRGNIVDTIINEEWKFEKCDCKKKKESSQLNLFNNL